MSPGTVRPCRFRRASIPGPYLGRSHNESDFRNLTNDYRRRGLPHGGIIVLPEHSPIERLTVRAAMMLDWLGTMTDHRSGFFQWGHLQELLEQGYLLEGYTPDEIRLALAR